MSYNQNDDTNKKLMKESSKSSLSFLGNKLKNTTGAVVKKAITTIALLLKQLLVMLMPFIVVILFILGIFAFIYFSIFLLPKYITQNIKNTTNSNFSAIFGWSKNDKEIWTFNEEQELYNTYITLSESFKEGLDSFQIDQAERYKLSWALLAGVDRILGDPIIHEEKTEFSGRKPEPEKNYNNIKPLFEWEEFLQKTNHYYEREVEYTECDDDDNCYTYTVWESESNIQEIIKNLLINANTFENEYDHIWGKFKIEINSSNFTVYDYENSTIVFSYNQGLEVPEKFSEFYDLMKSAQSQERNPKIRNVSYSLTRAFIKEIVKKGEHLKRYKDMLEEHNITSDLELDFILHLASIFDDTFNYDLADIYNITSSLIDTTQIYWEGAIGTFFYPIERQYNRISSPFGNRIHPIFKDKRFHRGVDIPAPTGTELYSALNGQVIFAGNFGGYGKAIIIDHGKYKTLYAHLSKIDVRLNKEVTGGQYIGQVGSTGNSTGPHLHFEVREMRNNKEHFIDPIQFFK